MIYIIYTYIFLSIIPEDKHISLNHPKVKVRRDGYTFAVVWYVGNSLCEEEGLASVNGTEDRLEIRSSNRPFHIPSVSVTYSYRISILKLTGLKQE